MVEYAEARCSEVKEQRGLMDLSMTFLRGSVFGHPSLPVMGKFDRIHVGANCPKGKLRDLLRLLKPGKFFVPLSLPLSVSLSLFLSHSLLSRFIHKVPSPQ